MPQWMGVQLGGRTVIAIEREVELEESERLRKRERERERERESSPCLNKSEH